MYHFCHLFPCFQHNGTYLDPTESCRGYIEGFVTERGKMRLGFAVVSMLQRKGKYSCRKHNVHTVRQNAFVVSSKERFDSFCANEALV